jgi:hypothetical protein
MPSGFVVLGAISASWGLFKDIVSFLRHVYDGRSEIPAVLLRFENDCCLMAALEAFFTETVLRSLRDDDLDHLQRVFSYLLPKLQNVAVRLRRIGGAKIWDQAKWVAVGKSLKTAEADIYEWVQRLQYPLMLLPAPTKRSLLETVEGSSDQASKMISMVGTQFKIEARVADFHRAGKEVNAADVTKFKLVKGPVLSMVPAKGPQIISRDGTEQVVEFKRITSSAANDPRVIDEVEKEVTKLTSLFSQVADDRAFLLRPMNFFRSELIPTAPFGILYQVPSTHEFPVTLAEIISKTKPDGSRILEHSLDQRFELARQVATAVLFVHSTGWLHKGIHASNVILLYRIGHHPAQRSPICLGTAFLVGFDFSRRDVSRSTGDETSGSDWGRQIYQHPARAGDTAQGYQPFLQEHDIYALGALLVEIGRWKALRAYPNLFKNITPEKRKTALEDMARGLSTSLGQKYVDITLRCLRVLDQTQSDQQSNPPVLDVVHGLQDLVVATR